MRPEKLTSFTPFYTRQNEVNEVNIVGRRFATEVVCQKNEVENEVFISISRLHVTESTNVSTDWRCRRYSAVISGCRSVLCTAETDILKGQRLRLVAAGGRPITRIAVFGTQK